MVTHRDFSANLDEALKNRPSFTLQGVDFLCKPGLRWKAMASAVAALDEAESPEEQEEALLGFFDVVLVKTARPKMRELLDVEDDDDDDDDAVPVSMKQLTDIVRWLVEQYTGTPTQPSSDSSASPNGTGDPSKVATSTAPAGEVPSPS
jgi:hypothetical protein